MDTSEKYILMCQEAKEIQELHNWQVGDYYAYYVGQWYSSVFIGHAYYAMTNQEVQYSDWIWLPRQDQLQEIAVKIFDEDISFIHVIMQLHFTNWHDCHPWDLDWSMEQAWLEFVMERQNICKHKLNKE
jgi:hypothetical protein